MHINFLMVALTSVIPLIVGFVWYHKSVMGTVWMRETGIDPEAANPQKMAVVFGGSLLLSFLLAISLMPVTLHFMGLYSMLADQPALKEPNSDLAKTVNSLMTQYGSNFRTFKHGAFHGVLMSIFMVLPTIGINAIFERKSFKYVFVHLGYWAITMGLMAGFICAFA
jgi:Protein of unknown function (DUF1761)